MSNSAQGTDDTEFKALVLAKLEALEKGQKKTHDTVLRRTSPEHFRNLAKKLNGDGTGKSRQQKGLKASSQQVQLSAKIRKVVNQVSTAMQFQHGWNIDEMSVVRAYRILVDQGISTQNPCRDISEPVKITLGNRTFTALPAKVDYVNSFVGYCEKYLQGVDGLDFIESQFIPDEPLPLLAPVKAVDVKAETVS